MTDVLPIRTDGLGESSPINLKKLKAGQRTESANSQQGASAALRILEPARKKLGTVETQRIIECLDECIRRHELVASLMLILLPSEDRLEQFSLALGVDLLTAIKSHRTLCRLLDEAFEYNAEQHTTASLRSSVTDSSRNIMRLFSKNPAAVTTVRSELSGQFSQQGNPQLKESLLMVDGLNELRGILLEKLLTSPAEEIDRTRYLHQVTEREKNNTTVIDKLQAQLDTAIDDKEQEMSKRNENIRRLKNDLHQIEQFSEEHIRRTKTEADKQQAADTRGSEGKQSKLSTEADQIRDQLSRMVAEDRETEQHLRKRKFKIETEVENWIIKYDQDMGEKQDEYEQIDAVYTQEKKQLSELEEKFSVLQEEYDKIMEERRIAREIKEAKELELALMMKAAITIQAFFRAYKVRKALKSKAKKGGGKGGKGKKKK
uniref:Dynein regulatory complex protein 10 n=1 Tax=Ciona savignyi TaxID=51511 RepID=H2YX44_CIOSA